MPVWHASIAKVHAHGAWQVSAWAPRHRARATSIARNLLWGIGDGENVVDVGERAVHWRRRLSPAEIALLDPAWLALPAIDLPGGA